MLGLETLEIVFFLRNNYNVTALDINNEAYKKL